MAWALVGGGFWSPFCDLYNEEVADWFQLKYRISMGMIF